MWMMIRVVDLIFSKIGESPLYQSYSNIVITCHNHLHEHRGLVCYNPQLLRGLDIR